MVFKINCSGMSHVRYLIEDSDTGYIPLGDQLYLAITRGPSAAIAESDGQVQLVTKGYILTRVARVKMYKKALWPLLEQWPSFSALAVIGP